MKRNVLSVLLAGLLALGLSACSSTGMRGADPTASISNTSDSSNPLSDADSMAGTSAGAPTGRTGNVASVPPATLNSTVTSIEVVPRQGEGAATSAGTVAGAAVGGTSSAGSAERVFRITRRTDDGQTHTITQEWAPTFSTGDRVRMENGTIRR